MKDNANTYRYLKIKRSIIVHEMMNKKVKHSIGLLIASLMMGISSNALAIQANPNSIVENQPDGSTIEIRVRGDEHFNWNEDKDGYTIVLNKGWYKYAQLDQNGRLQPTKHIVGKSNPQALSLTKRILPPRKIRERYSKNLTSSNQQRVTVATGQVKNLVVMLRFADHAQRTLPSVTDIDVLFNKAGGDPSLAPTGSIRDVYLQNSYGQMDLTSTVQAWVTLSQSESYYANGSSGDSTLWQGLSEALSQLDTALDFSDFDANNDGVIDAITFLHSGYGAEWGGTSDDGARQADRIWSHRWAMQSSAWTSEEGVKVDDYHISPALWGTGGNEIGRIGVIAHETGHFFGLPDLYDTNGGGQGIGSYGLMANSWDFEGTQYCPPHLSPWSKVKLGWYQPHEIGASGEYSLRMSEQYPDVYKITQGFPQGEYLLVENRQNAGFDCTLPQGGLAIWHIDESTGHNTEGYPGQRRWPENGNHYQVALLQADGSYDMEKGQNRGDALDVYHSGGNRILPIGPGVYPNSDTYKGGIIAQTGNRIDNVSGSGNTMTFCINGCSTGANLASPSNLVATVTNIGKGKNTRKQVNLSWQDNADNEQLFVIERCEETGRGGNKVCVFSPLETVPADITVLQDETDKGTYKYRIKAVNAQGSSDYSNEVKI